MLAWWADRVVRNARAVVLTTIPVVVLLSYYVFTHLGINTETDGMMSDDLPWRRDYLAFEQKFSLFKDEILIHWYARSMCPVAGSSSIETACSTWRRNGSRTFLPVSPGSRAGFEIWSVTPRWSDS